MNVLFLQVRRLVWAAVMGNPVSTRIAPGVYGWLFQFQRRLLHVHPGLSLPAFPSHIYPPHRAPPSQVGIALIIVGLCS